MRKNEKFWLNTSVLSDHTIYKVNLLKSAPCISVNKEKPSEDTEVGRPKLSWDDASDRTKRRRMASLGKTHPEEELLNAAVHSTSNPDLKKVIKFAISSTSNAAQLTAALKVNAITPYTPDECVDLWITANHTKKSWLLHYRGAKKRNANMYVSWENLVKARNLCHPPGIMVTAKVARVPLQNLLSHTVKRIMKLQSNVIVYLASIKTDKVLLMKLIGKYGFDGSSGQSQYKVNFTGEDGNEFSDSNIISAWYVPLKMLCGETIVWSNPTPGST